VARGPGGALLQPSSEIAAGCATITAAKLIGETADVHRFRSPACLRTPRRDHAAACLVRQPDRHRFSRAGNRQLDAAIHRVAITQAHYHPDIRAFPERRRTAGDIKAEPIWGAAVWSISPTGAAWPRPPVQVVRRACPHSLIGAGEPSSSMRADGNGCERRPYRQPLRGNAEVADLGQVE
jgi:hypothetical protein